MAVHGVIPDQANLLLLTKSVVFGRHPYQLPENAGKGRAASLGFPGGVNQVQGEIVLYAW
jgi:hypothetical protein